MSVNIIENFKLGTDLPLDSRYVVGTVNDVSLYWYPGMLAFQTSDSRLYWYDGSIWNIISDPSIDGVSKIYVDGSLAIRDASISNLRGRIEVIDGSITYLTNLINIHESSIGFIQNELIRIDGSLNFIFQELSQLDASIVRIDASLGDYVRKDGDTMTGDLIIETDLSVNGRTTTGEFNVSGTEFPADPEDGDLFYRKDLNLLFVYDASRGKYLSTSRSVINGGRTTAIAGGTIYIRVGDATQSSDSGYRMYRNGTITAFSVQNRNTLTTLRQVQIRINNSPVITGTIDVGQSGFNLDNQNADVSTGDLVQISTVPSTAGSALNNWIALVEFAFRE